MEEIEFRAWDKSDKVMLYEGVDFPTKDLNYTYSYFEKRLVLQLKYDNSVYEGYELMQYTGFKDKNGKKIYRGDILEKEGYWSFYIGFKDGCFVTVPCEEVQRVNWAWQPTVQSKIKNWEVKGNIYENPELLN